MERTNPEEIDVPLSDATMAEAKAMHAYLESLAKANTAIRVLRGPAELQSVSLLPAAAAILRYLAEADIARTQEDIAAGSRVSRRTIGKRLKELTKAELVKTPEGRKRLTILTPKGKQLVANLPKTSP